MSAHPPAATATATIPAPALVAHPRFTRTAIALHWLVAVLMAVNVALILSVEYWPDAGVRPVIDTHKSTGITVLGLALLRLLWRLGHRPPPLPTAYGQGEKRAAHGVHWGLYALMFALPVTGWMHDSAWKGAAANPMRLFGTIGWPRIGWIESLDPATKLSLHALFGNWHSWAGYALYALVALHVLGALKHHVIDRDPILRRMRW